MSHTSLTNTSLEFSDSQDNKEMGGMNMGEQGQQILTSTSHR
jgi:hypothetical protein